MAHEADKHNFGAQVEIINRASGTWFQKPRTLFWEHLFFGRSSPLKSLFQIEGTTLDQHIFNLEIEGISPAGGYSRKIVESTDNGPAQPFGAGINLGYAYLFGIRDLHRFNVLNCGFGIQIIDAEAVFSKLLLPSETALLPFKTVSFEMSGISKILPAMEMTETQLSRLVFGFTLVAFHILSKRNCILKLIEASMGGAKIPIRVLLKDTGDYYDYLKGKKPRAEFLPEELIQLERGDIPYFFKFPGQADLFYYTDRNFNYSPVTLSPELERDCSRHALTPQEILIDVTEDKIARGILFVVSKFFGGFDKFIHTPYFHLKAERGSLVLELNNGRKFISPIPHRSVSA